MTAAKTDRIWVDLRFRDIDSFGHLYHAEYLTLLDDARTRWFGEVLGLDRPGEYVVARVEIDYVDSALFSDGRVGAAFEVERAGNTSLTLAESLIAPDGRLLARTRVVVVLIDLATGEKRKVPLTAEER